MSNRAVIHSSDAPQAIGPYSQAVKINNVVYLSGQIPLDPATMQLVEGGIEAQTRRVFDNLRAVARAADGDLDRCVKLTIYLTDLADFAAVNAVMAAYFSEPYPARATIQVSAVAARRGRRDRRDHGALIAPH